MPDFLWPAGWAQLALWQESSNSTELTMRALSILLTCLTALPTTGYHAPAAETAARPAAAQARSSGFGGNKHLPRTVFALRLRLRLL